jgi:hypothetical protein
MRLFMFDTSLFGPDTDGTLKVLLLIWHASTQNAASL